MNRRAFLVASLAAVAGCGSDASDAHTVAPNLRGIPSPTPTPTPDPTRSPGSFADGRTRPITLANNTHRETRVHLRVQEGENTVLDTIGSLGAALSGRVAVAAEPNTVYDVRVDADGGRRRSTTWRPEANGGHLWIGLEEDIAVRDGYGVDDATAFVTGDTGVVRDSPDEEWSPLVIDNPREAVSVQVAFSNGGGLGGCTLDVPTRTRLRLPIAIPAPEVDVGAVVGDAEAETEWRQWTDGPLHLCLDGPRFLCDPLYRDLRVVNDAPDARSVRVTVVTDGRDTVAESASVSPGETRIFRAVVPPAGRYVVGVEYAGEQTAFEIPACPPVGPFVVTLGVDGVRVTAREVDEEGTMTVTATERETETKTDTETETETVTETGT